MPRWWSTSPDGSGNSSPLAEGVRSGGSVVLPVVLLEVAGEDRVDLRTLRGAHGQGPLTVPLAMNLPADGRGAVVGALVENVCEHLRESLHGGSLLLSSLWCLSSLGVSLRT